jgi:diguanylate cyclase (GGDEF)-like protein
MSLQATDHLYFMPAAEKILQHLSSLINANTFFLACNDLKTNTILKAFNKAEILVKEGSIPFQESYCSRVVNNDINPTVISNTGIDPSTKDMGVTKVIGASCFVGFPITLRNGEVFGTLCAMDRKYIFTEKDLELIVSITHFIGYLIDLERDLYYDKLTGLYSRDYLNMFFSYFSFEANRNVSVFLINIDRFKSVNHSEEIGNFLLSVISKRIKACTGESGLAVRLHGDEFIVVNFDVKNDEERDQYAEKLLKAISEPIAAEFQEFQLKARIGVSTNRKGNQHIDRLIQQAVFAKDEIKINGSKRYAVCTDEIMRKQERKIWIELNLLQQLKASKFEMYYQPQYHIETGKVIGFEALVRWNTEEWGFISPGEFIPIAEASGLIIPLGDWIFRTVCQQISVWNKEYDSDFSVAINLSPTQFHHYGEYVDQLDDVFVKYGIKPSQLHFEITETSFLVMDEKLLSIMNTVRNKGIKIALDDFGTGYSSILYLRNLPIDLLKIDQVFVKGISKNSKDRKIIQALIDLAKSLDIKVVAEGIESDEILKQLDSMGCDNAQGYLLGKPMEKYDAEKLLGSREKES